VGVRYLKSASTKRKLICRSD